MKNRPILVIALLLCLAMAGIGGYFALRTAPLPGASPPAKAIVHDYEKYPYARGKEARVIDIGAQPNSTALLFVIESLLHDRILQRQLAAEGWTLRIHSYQTGKDMLPYADGRLDVLQLGDIPALTLLAQRIFGIFALTRSGHNALIGKRLLTPAALKGQRIGYPPGTTAHFALYQALRVAHLTFADIVPVEMQPGDMEAALRAGTVDAVAVWPPFSTAIIQQVPNTVATVNTNTFSIFAIELDFARRHPEQVNALLAAVVRSSQWARQSDGNVMTGLASVRESQIRFVGKSILSADRKWERPIQLLRAESFGTPSFPMLPLDLNDEGGLAQQQVEFLKESGLIPASTEWKTISQRLFVERLPDILREGKKWQVDQFDYAPDRLYPD
ncbi:MAG: ABC transporter substrate-binding protein [Candidatus Competibacter phosphatis]